MGTQLAAPNETDAGKRGEEGCCLTRPLTPAVKPLLWSQVSERPLTRM